MSGVDRQPGGHSQSELVRLRLESMKISPQRTQRTLPGSNRRSTENTQEDCAESAKQAGNRHSIPNCVLKGHQNSFLRQRQAELGWTNHPLPSAQTSPCTSAI